MSSIAKNVSENNHDSSQVPVKLLFIHHSVGGTWLAHDFGGLVNELNKNNFYVNDVTYGWEPPTLTDNIIKKVKHKVFKTLGKSDKGAYGIGNRTDIGQMSDWFLGSDSDLIMSSLYGENLETDKFGDHKNRNSTKPLKNPGTVVENEIIMFKSCYPNTLLKGNASDPPSQIKNPTLNFTAGSAEHTVANAKRIFNDQLTYFGKHPEKFFVIVTPHLGLSCQMMVKLPEDSVIGWFITG